MDIYVFCITWFIMLVVIVYSYKKGEFMNPAFLFTFPLFLSYNIFYLVFNKRFGVSDKTLILFACGLVCFNVGYFFLNFLSEIITLQTEVYVQKKYRRSNRLFLFLCLCIGLMSVVITFRYMMGLGLSINNYSAALAANLREEYINNVSATPFLVTYGKYLLSFSVFVYWYEFLNKIEPINKVLMYFLLLCCVAIPFLTLSRTDLLICILPIMFIYLRSAKAESARKHTKLLARYKYLKVFLLIMTLILFMGTLRDGTNEEPTSLLDPDSYLVGYLGYELVAFDRWVTPYPGRGNGFLTLEPVKKVVELVRPAKDGLALAPKGQFNVYSYLKAPYLDGGTAGVIIIMFLVGMLCCYIYRKSTSGNEYWEIFYATYTYGIIMSFFDWQFTIITFVYLLLFLMGVGGMNVSIFTERQGVYDDGSS